MRQSGGGFTGTPLVFVFFYLCTPLLPIFYIYLYLSYIIILHAHSSQWITLINLWLPSLYWTLFTYIYLFTSLVCLFNTLFPFIFLYWRVLDHLYIGRDYKSFLLHPNLKEYPSMYGWMDGFYIRINLRVFFFFFCNIFRTPNLKTLSNGGDF